MDARNFKIKKKRRYLQLAGQCGWNAGALLLPVVWIQALIKIKYFGLVKADWCVCSAHLLLQLGVTQAAQSSSVCVCGSVSSNASCG